MADAHAQLNDYRQSPRKTRVVANMVRGKKISVALETLKFMPKRASAPLQKLIASALSNAKNLNLKEENLIVKEIRVDGGAILYRRMPRSRGMSNPIRKRTSHVSVILTEKEPKLKKSKSNKPALSADELKANS